MNKVAAFALRRKNSILNMSEKMFCPPQPLRLVWVTPAYAGKSTASRQPACARRDHPRVCGEKTPDASSTTKSIGSPPRMRGKALGTRPTTSGTGITPAYAGKSLPPCGSLPAGWDHPRVCGEKCFGVICSIHFIGSPPRVREKEHVLHTDVQLAGITPACAGKSHGLPTAAQGGWDHPRVCGEKPREFRQLHAIPGSPPHVRGKVYQTRIQCGV